MSILSEFLLDGASSKEDVAETHNQMLRRSNAMWNLTAPRRPVEVFTDGDSLSVQMANLDHRSALWWAMAIYRLDITVRGGLGAGTSMSGTTRGGEAGSEMFGMTSEPRLLRAGNAFAQSLANGFAPIVIVSVQTNDNYAGDNGQGGIESTVANVEKYFVRMRLRGLAHMVINGGGPSAAGGGSTLRQRGIARAYRALAAKYRGQITFVDNSTVLAANTAGFTALGGQAVYGATMYDTPAENAGLHPSAYGAYLMGKHKLGPAMLALVGERTPLLGWVGDGFDVTLNSRGPLMGGQTRYGGSAINIPANTLNGTQTASQADVSDPIAAAFGRPDIIARELTLSGTPTASGKLTSLRTASSGSFDPTVTPFMPEAWMYVDMTNIKCPNFGWASGGVGGQGGRDCDVIPHLKELLCLYPGAPIKEDVNYGVRTASLSFEWIAGKETAGRIIYIAASDYPQPPLPLASA